MTYAEIFARRKALGMEHLSMPDFARMFGDNPEFVAGASGGTIGQAIKATSAGVDRFLGATGLPEATGEIFARIPQVATLGASGPSEAWRDAGRGIPRGAATTAATVLTGGVTGAVAMGGLTGVDVYEKTDSPTAGAVGAVLGMATPLAGYIAGRGAAGVATRVLPRVFSNEVTKAAVTRGVTVSAPGVFKSAATRAIEFAGQQAGYLGAGLLTQASTGAIAAPDGQGWEAFKAPFTAENIVMSAASNLPFMANDIMHIRAQNRVVRGEADAAAVAARYDEIDRLRGLNAPRIEGPSFTSSNAVTDRLGLSVNARESRLGLPWTPHETPAQRGYRELVAQTRLAASMPRNSPDVKSPAVEVKPLDVAEAFRRSQNELVYSTGLLRSVSREAPATVTTKLVDAAKLPVEQRLIADDPQVKYVAAAEVTGVSADDAVARITSKFDAGEDDSVATLELAQQLHAEATEAIAVQRRNEDRAAELSLRVAPVDAAISPSAEKIQTSAEQTAAFDDALRPFGKNAVVQAKLRETLALSRDSTQLNPDVILRSAVLRWKQESPTADAESLVQALRGVDKLLRKEGVDPASLMSVSEIRDDGTVVLQKGKALHFATRDEAEAARAKLQVDDLNNEFQWSVIRPQGADYFTITRRTYFRTAIGGDVTDHVMDSATAGLVPAADAPRMIVKDRARRLEEHAAAKIIDRAADGDDAVEQFVAKVPRDVVEELGTGDVDTGAARLEALLRLRAATTPTEKARWADVVRTSFGGDKSLTNAWLKDATTQGLLTAWDAQRGMVTATSAKKMLSLVPGGAGLYAGGGFFYNVGRFENGRIGKHVLPKNGRVSVELFAKIGRGDDRPLQKNEVELYKLLVPEAFDGTNVDVPVLFDGLRKAEPTVEVRTLGAGSDVRLKQRSQLQHEIETAGYSVRLVAGDAVVRDRAGQEIDLSVLAPELRAKVVSWASLNPHDESQINDATRYSSVAPRADMPGYVEGLVRVPLGKDAYAKSLFGQAYDKLFPGQKADVDKLMASGKTPRADLYSGPHFGSEDTNVVGFFRGYMETLPDGAKAFHVIEVQSDWAQRQRSLAKQFDAQVVEKDGKFRVVDGNGRSAYVPFDTRAEAEAFAAKELAAGQARLDKTGHPLLPAYENLALKAAIKHARDNGATKLILSDAETAMMTEGHDRREAYQAPPDEYFGRGDEWIQQQRKEGVMLPEEGGMRLHYDTTLPSTMSRITGNKGTKVDFGPHKNQVGASQEQNQAQNSVPETPQSRQRLLDAGYKIEPDGTITRPDGAYGGSFYEGELIDSNAATARTAAGLSLADSNKGSPVFRNPDGTPKTNITGTVYDISGVAIGERGSGPAFGGNVQPAYVGQRRTLSELLRTVGLDDTWTDEAARLVTLYDSSDVAYAQITGATDAAGLFTVQRDGQKLVWLSQQNNPRRTLFALTHELNGHALWQAMRDGRLDAETTNRMQQFESFVKESSPETNRVMLQELWRHLPDDVRKDAGLKKLVDLASSDPEEVLANINAVASLNLVHSTKSVWRDMLTYLPKPLADVLVAMARMSRRMFESINGLMFSREHGWNAGAVNAKARAELGTYIDSLYGVLRYDRERSAQAAKALRMGLLTDSEARFTAMQSPEYWVAANADEATVLQAMGLVNEAETKPNSWLPEGSIGFTRMFGGMGAFAVKYPELRRLLNTGPRREAESALLEKAAMSELGFERQGFKIVAGAPESNPILRVEQVVRLAEQRDAIIQRANVTQKPVEQLIAEGDAKVMATLNGMTSEDQTMVRSALAQHESFNKKINALTLEKKYDRLAFITAEALLNKDANMSVATAETLARELIAARRGGKPFAGNEPNAMSLASFVDTATQGIEDTHAFFVQRPYYVSYRRFGEFSTTVKFSDKRPEIARSFDTQEARDTWLSEFDGDPRASVKLHKNKFRTKNALGNEALEVLREHESKNLEALTSALVVNGMDADTAKTLVGRFSTYGEVQRELAAKAVPGKAPHRRFVAGYEELNTTEQQMQYLQLLSHGLTKGVADAEFNMLMAGPQGRAFVDRDTIRKAWEQYKTPDSATVKNVRKASYLMYMLLHPINMIQDAAAPLIGALPAWMINDGAGVVEAHKLIGAAMKDVKSSKRTTADEQAMLKWFRDSNQGLASYSDESNNDALKLHNLHAVANGRKTAAGLGEWLGQKTSSALLHAKQIHRHATNYGMEAAMLATYRWQRGKGLDHNAAVAAAFDFTMPAMAAQGKSGRAQGIWDAGVLTPVTASITSLQAFASNMFFTAKGTFERAIGRVPGLTAKQRVDAGKAFVATVALMAVTGGIMGVPIVSPALTIIDKVFGTNSREALADMLRGDDDDSYDDVVQQVAMHGALSITGGPDFGSRFASQGFLGFNGYDGWSVESMLGTGYDLVKRVFTLPAKLADEGVGALTALAPQPFKRGLDAWKNDWEFRRKDGSLIDESTPWEQSLHAVLGVKPVRIANIQERDTWQRIDAQNDSDARAAWLDDMMSLMDDGRFDEVRQQTVQRAAMRDGERPDMIAQKLAEQYVERLYGRVAGRRPGFNGRLARTSPGDSMTETQRLVLEDSVRQRLNMGFATSPAMLRRARDVDAIRALNPTMSVKSAREFIERRSGATYDALRGATYRSR